MKQSRTSYIAFAAMILMAVFVSAARPTMAQDVSPAATELIQLPVVATTEAGAPVYGVILPTVAAEVTPVPTSIPTGAVDSTTTSTIFNGLVLLVVVLVVALLAMVFMVLRSRAASGDEAAQRWLAMLNAGRDNFFPRETTEARVQALKEEAKRSPGMLDDFGALLVEMGWHVISPQQQAAQGTTQTVTMTSTSQPVTPTTPYPPSTGRDLGLDLTTGPKTEPTGPDGGAASGSANPFPPAR